MIVHTIWRRHSIASKGLSFGLDLPVFDLKAENTDNKLILDVDIDKSTSVEEESIDEVDDDPNADDIIASDDEVDVVSSCTLCIFR